jgi:CRISPR-associated endonuclease Csn1
MIFEELAFGIDLGIGSCGWAVLRNPPSAGEAGAIVGAGSWIFDVPETDKERIPTSQIRRNNRLLRRVVRRRRNRMADLRRLLHKHGLLPSADPDAFKRPGCDPWELRARGLDKPLKPVEFAVALGHIAKRRGFKSAAKRKAANASGDDKKMLVALEATQERLSRYRTVGEMFARDPDFANRRRNRDGVYDRTASRDDLEYEVKALFAAQRRLGQSCASQELEERYFGIAFRQLPMQDSEKLVGTCAFEPAEKRAAKLAPSFERFRLLTRLVNLRITTPEGERSLTPDELARATSDLGKTARLSVKRVRELIGLPVGQRFTTIKPDEEGRDIVVRTGEAMSGTAALRKALGETLWADMQARPEQLDRIAHVLSFFETNEKIKQQLNELGLDQPILGALLAALDVGAFAKFKGAAHISTKAVRKLLPYLAQGKRYDEACTLAGYDHAASTLSRREQITSKKLFNALVAEVGGSIANPVARKALTEGLKQLWAMRNRYGLPGAIHIELARDVGNSIEKRRELENAINKNTAQRERERDEVRELLNIEDVSGDTLLRYRLWKEQGGRCLYTDKPIPPESIIATDNSVQIDHILPRSRLFDNSFNNLTLAYVAANQHKKNRTPYEWFAQDKAQNDWDEFVARVETNKNLRGFKKRNFLLKNAEEREAAFRSRNLNDTRYAARLLAEAVKLFYPYGNRQERDGRRRVFTRPGAVTAELRKVWGVESLKKVDGQRVSDDRHHALDAIIVAAVSEAQVGRLITSFQQWEQQGLARPFRRIDPPWDDFRADVEAAYENVFVARPERRRARGEGHAATIRQVKERNNQITVFERKAILALKDADLERIKDPERNAAVINAIRAWIAAGRPADALPRSPRGDVITKVRLLSKNKPAVRVRGGTADRGEMVRVDVFSKPNRRGKLEWYLVPIYPHQVMNRKGWPQPPMRAVVAYKDEEEWTKIDSQCQFRFSLYPRSYVKALKSNGEVFEGYFKGLDRSTGAIALFSDRNPKTVYRGIGAKTLLTIEKYSVDRFGVRAEIRGEVRTWHGEAFTSPSPPD